jgi:hypothetical protein
VPDRGQKLILADHAVTVPDQVNKEIEDLGLNSHYLRSPPELAAVDIERAFFEQIAQVFAVLRAAPTATLA